MSERWSLAETADYAAAHGASLQVRRTRNWVVTVVLALADVATFAVAGTLFRRIVDVPHIPLKFEFLAIDRPVDVFYVMCAIFVVARYLSGDYSRRLPFWEGARLTTISVVIVAFPIALFTFFSGHYYSTFAQVSSWIFVIFGLPLSRQLARYLLDQVSLWWLPSALIVEGLDATEVIRAFSGSLSLGFDVRFHVPLGDQPVDRMAFPNVSSIALSDPGQIVARLVEAGCSEILVATDHQQNAMVEDLVQHALAARMGVAFIAPARHRSFPGVSVNYFFDRDFVPMPARSSLSWALKRLVDVIGSIVLLTVFSPILLLFGYLIRRDGGQALFVQPRVGLNGEEFPCIKFRTMAQDAEAQLAEWRRTNSPLYQEYLTSNFKLKDDPRVTSFGKWLRRTSLDELPQLINVLQGHMSLVGPRPLIAREISSYGVTFKLYRQIRPGLTGLWQVSGRSRTTFSDRVSLDYWYIRNWSLLFDVIILFKTVGVLISKDGAY
ncbi:MAG: exopolysaccharide biosynthesis polyprenyl glycosylphosphotransferase [Proteobacteria bacterium]|nr:exopolysaccharide biosynthesis polyprenyl glycosylphosphotransferase [Pseudomonadota bacterium]